ncbi:MAG: glycosyltransferase [Thermomicrobiales bacterium]
MNSAHSGQIRRASAGDWSIVVVNYNGDPFLSACLESIGKIRLRPRDVFVVDNASTDSSLYEMHGYPWAEVLKLPENRGFAGGANAGLARVETSVAVILNRTSSSLRTMAMPSSTPSPRILALARPVRC